MKDLVKIRGYNPSDKAEILSILELNIPQYFAESERNDLEIYLETGLELYYVLEFDDKIVGCGGINFDHSNSVAVISWDIIHPNYQGKSFGSQLLNYRLEQIKKLPSIQKIIVRTSQLTFQFYEKNGFKLNQIEKDYWAKGFDLYFMTYQNDN